MTFNIIGKGFIYPKHEEAIKSIGGKIVDSERKTDWVVIITPNYFHFDMIVKAVNEGSNVLCEKPLTLSSGQCKMLSDIERVQGKKIFTVCQLRYLPFLNKIEIKDHNEIEIFVDVHRDEEYFKTWKGDPEKSGGILFNLGIHYFDLIIHLFGEPKESNRVINGPKENSGWFKGDNYVCRYIFSYKAPKDQQRRVFRINGVDYNLETKENLHRFVYQDLLKGIGINPEETIKSIKLIEDLK